jgi:SPP1 gp7 family putative phage head morphogenesis protein
VTGRAPTLQLGRLTGVWAAVYRRRDQLERQAADQVLAVWQELAADLDLTAVMTALRQQVAPAERSPAADRRRHVLQATGAAVLAQLSRLTSRLAWPRLIAALTAAMGRGRSAGARAGHAVATDDGGELGDDEDDVGDVDVDLAAAYTVTAAALRGTAQTIARALLTAAERGDDERAMLDQVAAVIADGAAWSTSIVTAVGAAWTDGMADAYQQRNVQQLSVVTVGDGRVCPVCVNAEDASPYPAATAPRPPLHPLCRCTLQPA